MASLRQQIRSSIGQFIKQHHEEHIPVDILRVIQEEAMLMKETEELRDLFLSEDPFEVIRKQDISRRLLEPFVTSIQVVDCSRQRVGHDYCRIDAVVATSAGATLTFRYVRQPRDNNDHSLGQSQKDNGNDDHHHHHHHSSSSSNNNNNNIDSKNKPCHVWYSIEVSSGPDRPKNNLLVVEIFAPKSSPTLDQPAVCINGDDDGEKEDEEDENGEGNLHRHLSGMNVHRKAEDDYDDDNDGWEDIEDTENGENDANEHEQVDHKICCSSATSSKRRKLSDSANVCCGDKQSCNGCKDEAEEDDSVQLSAGLSSTQDCYVAYLDPDLLHDFVRTHFSDKHSIKQNAYISEATAFFILMTFPFYEHEWDIVGYVLDEVFGHEDDEDDEEDE
jgi:hypothetical protein